MSGYVPTKGWRWPEHEPECPGRPGYKGICNCRISTTHAPGIGPLATVDQLRRDRDELVEALELAIRVIDQGEATKADEAGLNDAETLLARVRASRPASP